MLIDSSITSNKRLLKKIQLNYMILLLRDLIKYKMDKIFKEIFVLMEF